MVGSGGTTEQYMSLIASQTKKREMLAEQKGMSKATSDDGYESSLTAFDNLYLNFNRNLGINDIELEIFNNKKTKNENISYTKNSRFS